MKKIKKYIGGVLLMAGSFITTYNLFSFKYFDTPFSKPHYYYSSESLFLLSLGVALIVLGILIIKKKND